jgi:hypothetical protein
MKKYLKYILLLGFSLVLLTGCTSDLVTPSNNVNQTETETGNYETGTDTGTGDSNTQTGGIVSKTGTLEMYLTDAPGDYQEVNIEIAKIEGHIAIEGEDGYWEVLKEWPAGYPVNLIELENTSILLASLELEPNQYTQLRIFLNTDASLVMEGEEGPEGPTEIVLLEIPSSENTGIKLNHPFEIVGGMVTKLTIDFDARKSIIKTGNGKYKMKPVISLSSENYPTGEVPEGAGSVSGTVSYYNSTNLSLIGIGEAEIELTGGSYLFENTTTSSAEEPLGLFSLTDVPAGEYMLNVYADDYGDYSENIEVMPDTDTLVDVVFLTEEPGMISGTVLDSVTLLPVEEAVVSAELDSGYTFYNSSETDESGIFNIDQLPVGSYDLTILADGYYDTGEHIGIAVDEGAENNIGEIWLAPSTS